jgi:hypothetical protein
MDKVREVIDLKHTVHVVQFEVLISNNHLVLILLSICFTCNFPLALCEFWNSTVALTS